MTLGFFLRRFTYDKRRRVLTAELSELGVPPGVRFPDRLRVRSETTGRTVTFVKDEAAARRAEFWDGELYEYRSIDLDPPMRAVLLND